MILALLVLGGSLAFLGWLAFTLAIYALPCFAGISVGMLAHQLGAGPLGDALVGFVAGVLSFVFGQVVIGGARSPILRLAILAIFVVPAGVVGFGIARAIAAATGANGAWAIAAGLACAAVTMTAAFARLLVGPEGAGLSTRAHPGPLAAHR